MTTTRTRAGVVGATLAALCLLAGTALAGEKASPEQLWKEAQELRMRSKELGAAGSKEDAHELLVKAERLEERAKAAKLASAPRGPKDGELAELKEKAVRLRAEIGELAAAGKKEQAAELEQKLIRLKETLGREGRPPGPEAERERFAGMKEKIGALHQAGKHEEAERLEQELRGALAKGGQRERELRERERRPGPERPDVEEAHRRMHHLRVAADNLRALGMHGEAERFARQAEEIERHLGGDRGPGPEPGGMEPRLRELQGQINELREAVQDLSRRLEAQGRRRF